MCVCVVRLGWLNTRSRNLNPPSDGLPGSEADIPDAVVTQLDKRLIWVPFIPCEDL